VIPLCNPRTTREKYSTPNGGTFVEPMNQLDGRIGEILSENDSIIGDIVHVADLVARPIKFRQTELSTVSTKAR
jgi:hypothetical protein